IFSTKIPTHLPVIAAGPWEPICAGNPRNKIRGCDIYEHFFCNQGVDVICRDGSTVYAPFSGVIRGQVNPTPLERIMPLIMALPVSYRGRINKGQKIGVMLPMQSIYRDITSHVHVQNCDLSDPTRNL
uniref:Uncharacterized protein n=1 Tax=Chrysemys picta bellii TaxID=8478 RepID=A0A8C3H9N8_CHRPI